VFLCEEKNEIATPSERRSAMTEIEKSPSIPLCIDRRDNPLAKGEEREEIEG
jgi:hypothetical protein